MHEQFPIFNHLEQEKTGEMEIIKLSKDLLGDYYQSFRLAQGEAAVQPALFHFLASQHKQAGHRPIMTEALNRAVQRMEQLLPPRHHLATTEGMRNDKQTGFQAIWNSYADILSHEPAPYRSLELILNDILLRDIKYQIDERPNRTERQDVHESVVREYILGSRLSGSPQLKEVKEMLKSTLLSTKGDDITAQGMRERFNALIKAWEDNHSESSFLSILSDQSASFTEHA